MDVTALALRAVAARPRVLLATLPGGTAARLKAERLVRLRDWPLAATPAQADLLLIAGPDCPQLHGALDRLWRDLPAPRARVHALDAEAVGAALDEGRALLGSLAGQREQATTAAAAAREGGRQQSETSEGADETGDDEHPDWRGKNGEHEDEDGGLHQDGDTPHGGGQVHTDETDRETRSGHEGQEEPNGGGHGGHQEHGGHDHGDMEMPGGLPMAEQGQDRDGLTLDRLHVPLGPFLADWPAGLSIRMTVQGDVVQEAVLQESVMPGHRGEAFWVQPWLRAAAGEPVTAGEAARRRAAARLDSLARLLAVAGWPAEAVAARRLRDDLLDGAPATALAPRLDRLARRVGRSRTLAWLTRGIGQLSTTPARQAGVSGPAARAGGDVTDRYRQWLADIRRDMGRLTEGSALRPAADESPRGHWRDDDPPSAALIKLMPGLLTGEELAAARLIVASLDPDLDELAAARREAGAHG
ncbi:hypothetical protein [Streptomyces sp. NPDC044948]|uniref:hypothetical protein n=1 Tax=Streptomyces sp. NPDC044948 TaxID=3157092 RepID=UPI0033FBFA9D